MGKGFEGASGKDQVGSVNPNTTIAPLKLIGALHTILQRALAVVVVVCAIVRLRG